jgi:peptidoglycan/LPS O-acetylase OafA/YrhL
VPETVHPADSTAQLDHRDLALDGLRGFAVLLVFLYHYGGGLTSSHPVVRLFGMLTASGWIGVQIFFALSGFLITSILWRTQADPRSPHRLRNFYARRALRILPLFYGALIAACIVTVVHDGMFTDMYPLRPEFFFLQDIPRVTALAESTSMLPIYHFWSLAVEEQFYLLWPFALLLCRTRRAALALCAAVFLLSVGFCIAVYSPAHLVRPAHAVLLDRFLLTNMGGLAAGSLIAIGVPARFDVFSLPLLLAGLATFLISSLIGGSFTLAHPHQMFLALPGIWIASACLIHILLRPGALRRLFSNSALGFIGRISYGLYVFHLLLEPIYSALARRLTHAATGYVYLTTRMCIAFALTLVAAWLSFHLFEFPILKLKRYFPLRSA